MSMLPSGVWGELSQLLAFQKSIAQLEYPNAKKGFQEGKTVFLKTIFSYYQTNEENKPKNAIDREFSLNPKSPSDEKVDQIFEIVWNNLSAHNNGIAFGEISLDALENYHLTLKESRMQFWKQLPGGKDFLNKCSVENLSPIEFEKIFKKWIEKNQSSLNSITKADIHSDERRASLNVGFYFTKNTPMLPPEISSLAHLKTLSIAHEQIQSLPNSIENFTHLKSLQITSQQIKFLPKNIGNLTNLKHMRIDSKSLEVLPDSIGNLTHLKTLYIISKQITSLPDSIGNLMDLEALFIFNCKQLDSLPHSIGKLSKLKKLEIVSSQCLTRLPESIGDLGNLERFSITSCDQLTCLPDSFGNLINLKHFHLLNQTKIDRVPNSFKNLIHLQTIGLSGQRESLLHSIKAVSDPKVRIWCD